MQRMRTNTFPSTVQEFEEGENKRNPPVAFIKPKAQPRTIYLTLENLGSRGNAAIFLPSGVRTSCSSFLSTAPRRASCSMAACRASVKAKTHAPGLVSQKDTCQVCAQHMAGRRCATGQSHRLGCGTALGDSRGSGQAGSAACLAFPNSVARIYGHCRYFHPVPK